MRKYRVWVLTDCNGTVIIKGRKKDVEIMAYHRFVYDLIFNDCLIRTEEWL